jgi:hypothetical protein
VGQISVLGNGTKRDSEKRSICPPIACAPRAALSVVGYDFESDEEYSCPRVDIAMRELPYLKLDFAVTTDELKIRAV